MKVFPLVTKKVTQVAHATKDESMPIIGHARELVWANCESCAREFLTWQYYNPVLEEQHQVVHCVNCKPTLVPVGG